MCFSLLLTHAGRQVALPQEAWRDEGWSALQRFEFLVLEEFLKADLLSTNHRKIALMWSS